MYDTKISIEYFIINSKNVSFSFYTESSRFLVATTQQNVITFLEKRKRREALINDTEPNGDHAREQTQPEQRHENVQHVVVHPETLCEVERLGLAHVTEQKLSGAATVFTPREANEFGTDAKQSNDRKSTWTRYFKPEQIATDQAPVLMHQSPPVST